MTIKKKDYPVQKYITKTLVKNGSGRVTGITFTITKPECLSATKTYEFYVNLEVNDSDSTNSGVTVSIDSNSQSVCGVSLSSATLTTSGSLTVNFSLNNPSTEYTITIGTNFWFVYLPSATSCSNSNVIIYVLGTFSNNNTLLTLSIQKCPCYASINNFCLFYGYTYLPNTLPITYQSSSSAGTNYDVFTIMNLILGTTSFQYATLSSFFIVQVNATLYPGYGIEFLSTSSNCSSISCTYAANSASSSGTTVQSYLCYCPSLSNTITYDFCLYLPYNESLTLSNFTYGFSLLSLNSLTYTPASTSSNATLSLSATTGNQNNNVPFVFVIGEIPINYIIYVTTFNTAPPSSGATIYPIQYPIQYQLCDTSGNLSSSITVDANTTNQSTFTYGPSNNWSTSTTN